MTDDIVTRLRTRIYDCKDDCGECILDNEAADEIERLMGLVERAYKLAVGHGIGDSFDSYEEALDAYESRI